MALVGPYEVNTTLSNGELPFGIAMDAAEPGQAVAVVLRGVYRARFVGALPVAGGFVAAAGDGAVRRAHWGEDGPLVLKVHLEDRTVEILL